LQIKHTFAPFSMAKTLFPACWAEHMRYDAGLTPDGMRFPEMRLDKMIKATL